MGFVEEEERYAPDPELPGSGLVATGVCSLANHPFSRREPPPSTRACLRSPAASGAGVLPTTYPHRRFSRREPPPSRSAPPPPLTCTLGENLRRRRQGSGAPPSLANHPFSRPNSTPALRTPTNHSLTYGLPGEASLSARAAPPTAHRTSSAIPTFRNRALHRHPN